MWLNVGGGFSGGPVVKTLQLPLQGSIPGWGTKIPHAAKQSQNIFLKIKNKQVKGGRWRDYLEEEPMPRGKWL